MKWLLATCSVMLLNGCYDDTFRLYDENLTEGEVLVSFDANFELFAEADLTRSVSGGTSGDVLKDLDDLCLILYDKNGDIVSGYPKEVSFTSVEDVDRNDGDGAYEGSIAEAKTKHASFNASVPVGDYYIIGVANLGNDKTGSSSTIEYLNSHASEIQTLHNLRKMKMDWDNDHIEDNDQMLGYFDLDRNQSPNANTIFPLVGIHSSGLNLKSWLRRCASKITIDFDGSALRDNVYVYLKDVKVMNIPATCTLGFGKVIKEGSSDVEHDYNNAAGNITGHESLAELLQVSADRIQKIEYGQGSDFNNWPCITNGSPYLMETIKNVDGTESSVKMNLHTETSPALFFYENMQGDSPHPKVSTVDPSTGKPEGSGNKDYDYDGKYDFDGLPCGTYIEVTAHYISTNYDNVGDSEIKYRFMIGKDAIKNCDAERNSHFKLTLKLRGNANDYDWHVDYQEEEGFDAPNPWYVSYVYNHSSMMPFKYTPPAGYELVEMKAEIIENHWYPRKNKNGEYYEGGDAPNPYDDTSVNGNPCNGFLALRSPLSESKPINDGTVVTQEDITGKAWNSEYNDDLRNILSNYYKGTAEKSDIDKSTRTFYITGDDKTNTGNEQYTFMKEHDNVMDIDKYTFNVPLFTREKVLVKHTGYTGNNPFVSFDRSATLRLTAVIKNKSDGSIISNYKDIEVIQVKRLVNPKGVYRKSGNNQDFHVVLMERNNISETSFQPLVSDGPWRAEILGDNNFITLDGKQTVSGHTRTNIDFNIKFNKTNHDNKVRNAIVRILYNNYTCTHLIFVRQGYAPQALSEKGTVWAGSDEKTTEIDGALWHTCNLIAEGYEAEDPRDEGSMFKFGNISDPIDAFNNVYDGNALGDGAVLLRNNGEFGAPCVNNLKIAQKDKKLDELSEKKWSDISFDSNGFGSDSEISTVRHFEQLYLTPYVQFGYGVLYADGATETQREVNLVFGYNRWSPGTEIRGMRGIFAYYYNEADPSNEFTAHNLFFPIGRSAYGHRKNERNTWADKDIAGTLRYACSRQAPAVSDNVFIHTAPLFCSLYRREGAIYWAQKYEESNKFLGWDGHVSDGNAYALDMNYFSFDVNTITNTNVAGGADACFVRCVEN